MGRITGLIDFELAHVGDPLSELAVLPVRDTIKNLGDLSTIAMAWSDITGEELDYDVLDFHGIAYNAHAVLSAAPLIIVPRPMANSCPTTVGTSTAPGGLSSALRS